jgi:uncharacterized protein (TIGR02270 family)
MQPGSPVIPSILEQHLDEAASLYVRRRSAMEASDLKLASLMAMDKSLAAHLDALGIGGEHVWSLCDDALAAASEGLVFAAGVRAIEDKQHLRLASLFSLAAASPEMCDGLSGAFGWMEREKLRGIVLELLGSTETVKRHVGIAACAQHRVDPGLTSGLGIQDPDDKVRALALKAAGELGVRDVLSACLAATSDGDTGCQFWAAWSAVLLGDRNRGLSSLSRIASTDGRHREVGSTLAIQAFGMSTAHAFLKSLAGDGEQLRWLIRGSGIAGDPAYVPWLIGHMRDEKTARLAVDAFSLLSGVDVTELNLEGAQPENFESGPNDDPDDPNVDMDPDEGLPWPDSDKIEKWWEANGSRFQKGTRYFVGAPVTREHCIDVLKNGYQRQRILAAHYLCLLEPGTPLFNTSAPAWRQQRRVMKMM